MFLKLHGVIGSKQSEFSKNVHFSELEPDHDFLPHLWAQSRIAELVDEAALNGENEELRREIERLSKTYGVPTPYTSFIAADDGSLGRIYRSTLSDAYTSAIPIHERIGFNRELEKRKHARYKIHDVHTRYIGRKTFHRHNRIWIDSEYDGKSDRKQVEFGSDEYYALMDHLPELAKYSKLAQRTISMIICYKDVNYEITPPKV